jgi:hypothetical protein
MGCSNSQSSDCADRDDDGSDDGEDDASVFDGAAASLNRTELLKLTRKDTGGGILVEHVLTLYLIWHVSLPI